MPEVITDTSPIQYLYQINQLNLLPTLYEQVKMPQAVADELAQGRASLPDSISLNLDYTLPCTILHPDSRHSEPGDRRV